MSKPTYAELEQQLQALRAVETELRDTTRQYRTLVKNLNGMVYHCQNAPAWTMEYVSAGALDLTGYPPEVLVGSRVARYGDLIHPDDRQKVWDAMQAAIEQQKPFTLIYRLRTRTGEEKWVREQGRAVFSAAGELEALDGIVIDITEQQQIRLAQRESEAFYRSLFEEHPAIMFLIDPDDNKIIDANQAACDFYYWSRDELCQMNIAQINTLAADELQAEIKRARTVGQNQFFFKHRRADGSIRDVEVFSGPIKRHGKTLRFSIIQDITERRWAEDQLRLSLERLSLATASARTGIWDTNLRTGDLIWDNRMYELYGLDPKTTRSSPEIWAQALHPDDLPAENAVRRAALEGSLDYHVQFRVIWPDGQIRHIEAHAAVQRDDAGQPLRVIGVNRDITDQVLATQALADSEARYRLLFDNNPHPMLVYNQENLAFLAVNNAAIAKYGYSQAEFLAMTIKDIRPPENVPDLLAHLTKEHSSRRRSAESRHRLKDGQVIEVEINSHLIDFDGQPAALVLVRDITARKRVERAFRESEERLRLFIDHAPAALAMFDREMRYLAVSRRWLADYNLGDQNLIGQSHYDIFPDIPDRWKAIHRRGLAGEVLQAGADQFERMDGTVQWLHWEVRPWYTTEGAIGGIVIFSEDITARKQADEALRQSEERYRNTLENMMEGCQIIGFNWRYLYLNDAADKHNRRPKEELLGQKYMEMWPGIETTEVFSVIKRCMEERIAQQMENEFVFPDGAVGWFSLSIQPVPEGVFILSVDITERKRAEEALRESEASLRQSQRVAHIGHWTWNPVTNQVVGSDEMHRIFGFEPGQFPGDLEQIIAQVIHPEDRAKVIEANNSVLTEQKSASLEFRVVRPDQSVHTVLATAGNKVTDECGNILKLTGIVQDITELKHLEEENEKLAAQFYQAQKMDAIGQLAGGIAHDFNNLLVPIMGYAELGQMNLKPGDPLQASFTHISQAAERAANLIRQILAFSRRQILEMKPVDLNEVIIDFQKMLSRLLRENINLRVHLNPQLQPIKADQGQLEQVLLNLVVNARDAMPAGGNLTIETDLAPLDETYAAQHSGVKPGLYVMLAISDTGHGMDTETQQHIFEPFFTTKERGQGTGLGLATVFGIVKQHRGNIWVYSEPGQGATFKVYLPVAAEFEAQSWTKTDIPAGQLAGSETVLVVEDEAGVRQLVIHALQTQGYTVLEAAGPAEALELVAGYSDTIHLLLTDVIMPGMNGRQLYVELTPQRPDLKVLFMSGYTDNIIVHHSVLDPGVAFVAKPFSMQSLLRKVREVLGG